VLKPIESVSTQPPSPTLKAQWDGITVEYGCLDAIPPVPFATSSKELFSKLFVPYLNNPSFKDIHLSLSQSLGLHLVQIL
jgi:hypothetical protein